MAKVVRRSALYKGFMVTIFDNNSVEVLRIYGNTKQGLREIASECGMELDSKWTTQQFGKKLVDFLEENGLAE